VELAKFEAFLKQHETLDISALVRGSQRLAYPIKGYAYPATPFCLRM
jgi:ribosomal protein S6